MAPIVKLEQLRKRFGAFTALNGIDLAIPEGMTYGLIGPNGSGKTTLIRILTGLSRPSEGTAEVLGCLMPDRRPAARIGYMTQAEALYLDLTVEENLRFFGRLYDLTGPALDARIDELLALVDLAGRRRSLAEQLSGGMKRRLSLACALVHRPQLLVLDEPTVGVDPELRIQFWDHFQRLTESGVSILVSTHHLDEAWRCHRLCLLREGKVLVEGTPQDLRAESGAESLEDTFLFFARRPAP